MVANVLVELQNRNVDKLFDYNVPNEFQKDIKIGIRVKVPFNNMTLEGFIMGISNESSLELKNIKEIVDKEVILDEELLELGRNLKSNLLATQISVYQAMLPKALKAQVKTNLNKKMQKCIELNITENALINYKLTELQQSVIDEVLSNNLVPQTELNLISSSSVKTLINKGILRSVEKEQYTLKNEVVELSSKIELTKEQQEVIDKIFSEVDNNIFLLHGVTGSGKTEVYMEIIEKLMESGKNSIVLVPEISLTPQMLKRFKSRFGISIAILHSRLNETEKYDEYRRIARGEVSIVIGARSAIFAPLKNIGAIIIDEEHSSTYKQENNPKYNAIDVAILRSIHHKAIVILGSATPSLETYARAITGKYVLLELTARPNSQIMPNVELIDMSKEKKRGTYFSNTLIESINKALENKEQIILLLNRRGHSSFITCSNCGYVAKCPNCDITLTYHKTSDMCRCHYCGYAIKKLDICPSCHEESIQNLGVGTEKIEEELNKLFNARVVRMDFDTTTTKGAHEKIINDFGDYKYDILLGTQMIAKGLDFPNVTLVGVINADTSLMIPSFRSSENTFQLLSQVAGRSGRGTKSGVVIIQTFNPEHYAIKYAKIHDYKNFFKQEMFIRKQLKYSPYYYMTLVRIVGTDYEALKVESNKVATKLRTELKSSTILGPSIGSIFKVKNTYRFCIIIKYKKEDALYPVLTKLLDYYKSNSKIKIDIDFNSTAI